MLPGDEVSIGNHELVVEGIHLWFGVLDNLLSLELLLTLLQAYLLRVLTSN